MIGILLKNALSVWNALGLDKGIVVISDGVSIVSYQEACVADTTQERSE